MINKVVPSVDEAIAGIQSGATILVGGFGGAGIPRALLAGLLSKRDVGNLTLVNNNAGSGDPSFSKLVEEGRVAKIVCSYPRMPGKEVLLKKIVEGVLRLEVISQGTLVERMRAAGAGLGPFFTPTGYATVFAEGKESRVINGKGYVLETPLHADYAFVKANVADPFGNLVYRYASRNFGPVMCTAATTTIVEVDEIVEVGAIDPCHVVTPSVFVDRIVKV
jgi:3-oxoadipate CoA-transferase alpha subunit